MKLAPKTDIIRTAFVLILLFGSLQVLYLISQNKSGLKPDDDVDFTDLSDVGFHDTVEDRKAPLHIRRDRVNSRLTFSPGDKTWNRAFGGTVHQNDSKLPPLHLRQTAFLKPPYYPLKYGKFRPHKGFLTIGIPSVRRPNTDHIYLFDTLNSLIQNTDSLEQNMTTIVVMLSDFNTTYNELIARNVYMTYKQYCDNGFIQVIIPSLEMYPDLEHVRRTYNDAPSRLKWRAKQNIDYAYLFMYSANISFYYMQLEDDVISASGFFNDIRYYVKVYQHEHWFLLEFSFLGFIGKLFHSNDLMKSARYFLMYFDSMPCDLLLGKLRLANGQQRAYHSKYSLFQHLGKFSSLENKLMPAMDTHFKDAASSKAKELLNYWPKGDNPPAKIRTSLILVKNYSVDSAYDNDVNTYLWAHTPTRGDYFQLQFERAWNFSRMIVVTGDDTKKLDSLVGGMLMYSTEVAKPTGKSFQSEMQCIGFKHLTTFVNGEVDTQATGTAIPTNIWCLKILLTKRNKTWLMIREVILLF